MKALCVSLFLAILVSISSVSDVIAKVKDEVVTEKTPELILGKKLYRKKTCFACHGKNASKSILDYPNIGGMDKRYIITQMKDIKSGARTSNNDVTGHPRTAGMKQIMHLVNDEEIKLIANWISKKTRSKPSKNAQVSVENIEKGKRLYKKNRCATCHGKAGNKPKKGQPYIAGQKRAYLIKQMNEIKNKIRTNGKSKTMIPFIKKLSSEDIELLADYLSEVGRDK